MISKEDILKNFLKEDTEDVLKVYECMNVAYSKGISVFTKFFCKPHIWLYFIEHFNSKSFSVEANGAFDECDRKIIGFNNIYDIPFPYRVIKIKNKSKFSNLSHKDYLGSLMALGLEREKLGDLKVLDDCAIVPIYEEVADYILISLTTVGKSPVTVEEIYEESLPKNQFKEEIIIVSSLRADNIVSKLARVSRTNAIEFINSNKVLLDYCKVQDKSREVKENQRLTIKGVGKFIIGEIIGNTKSGKYRVKINKFI